MIVWWEVPLSQRLGGRRAERLIPGGKPGPMSWGWWRFPASHWAHLPSVQTALEGVGLGLQTWSRHRFPGNPLLAAPCSERSPAPPGLALPRGSAPFARAVCPRATSGPPRLLGVCTHCSLCPHFPQLPPILATPLLPGWCLYFRSRLQSHLSAPFTQASRQGEPSPPCVPASAPVYFWVVGFTFFFIP